ncbi:hypothetical protein [Thalassoroseus pseudoceratinae]|uniref:hypothetical protein n=1 Tax=Thalassoroseus pseudoceratinae TaxID=2713176 RepID=UPI00141E917D|nr:hypothetical protein [Thalassoroseus pseudoceratinae]
MTVTSEPPLQQLAEEIRDWRSDGLIVDRENRYVRNVALAGTVSKNGYRYTEQALQEATCLYRNKPVFLDHAPSASRATHRSTRDLVGSIVNPRFENGRVRGDIRVIDTEAGRTFLALAESDGPSVGMSHVVLAKRNANGTIVERLEQVVSVDAVVFPASTVTFRESHSPAGDDQGETLTLSNRIMDELNQIREQIANLHTKRMVPPIVSPTRPTSGERQPPSTETLTDAQVLSALRQR